MPSGSSQTLPRITPDKEVLFGWQHNHPNRALPILNVFRPGGQGRRGFRPGSESAPEKGSRAAICLACRSCKNIRVSLFTPGPRPPIIAASITSGRWICWTISVIWSVDLGTQSLQNGGLDVFGGVPKRSTGADCKSAGSCLRRFESYPLHHLTGSAMRRLGRPARSCFRGARVRV